MKGELNLDLVEIICKKCGNRRRALRNSLRHTEGICGNCWNWQVSDEDYLKNKNSN